MTEWPDWSGSVVAIVASGPSAKKTDLSPLKGRAKVLAIKKSIELVPWADVVYGCDAPWWKNVMGLTSFKGLKLSYDDQVVGQHGIQKVRIPDKHSSSMLFGEVGTVGSGGNSGFQALNLAVQFGSRRIILVGFDAQGGPGREHWYGRNDAYGMRNPDETNYRRWIANFASCSPVLAAMGVDVVNASNESQVRCFRRDTVEGALSRWL